MRSKRSDRREAARPSYGRYELMLLHPWADAIDLWMVFLASCPPLIYVETAYKRYLLAPGENAVIP